MLCRFLLVFALVSALRAEPLRVLLVTGGHAYDNSFHSVFGQPDVDWQITVDPHPRAFAGDIRKRYDVVVLYDMVVDGTDEKRQANLKAFAEAGKGIVILHHAILDYQQWPWFEQMAGGKYLREAEGEWPKSTFQHDVPMRVRVKAKHPVVAGIDDFEIEDETYGKMRIAKENLVLLQTDHPTSSGPVAWVSPYQKSRVVYVQLGHGPTAHRDATFRKLVRQAIEWSAVGVLTGRVGDRKLTANAFREQVRDFDMTRHGLGVACPRILPERMLLAFSSHHAAVTAQVAKQSVSLHPTTTNSRCASGGTPRSDSSRRCSRMSAIASRKLARHSSRDAPWPLAPGTSAQ